MWQYLLDNKIVTKPEDVFWANAKIAQSRCVRRFSVCELLDFVKNGLKGMRGYKKNYMLLFLQACHLIVIGMQKALK